ncbi:MAG: leucyl/phenylalanyl-tRNA--protein transferase [Pseudomonadota bacterium]
MTLLWLGEDSGTHFPPLDQALNEPNGLLAAGGDLSTERLLSAYTKGIFPWYCDGQPILWWSPDPRMVLRPDQFHCSRSLRKTLRKAGWQITLNTCFDAVIDACAAPRYEEEGTWITRQMRTAYCNLHCEGWAHSVEVCFDGELVGGLYGVAINQVFFGESMFSRRSDASKISLFALSRSLDKAGFALIDCQMHTPHLESLGARTLPRRQFIGQLQRHCNTLKKWQSALISVDELRN